MALSHSVFNPKKAYSHHDVYLYPASEGGGGLGEAVKVILSLGCSVISIAFYYLCGYFSLLMPYWL
jgi:hypothetical protein